MGKGSGQKKKVRRVVKRSTGSGTDKSKKKRKASSSSSAKKRMRVKKRGKKSRIPRKYYRSIQKLLSKEGHEITTKEIKSVPSKSLIKYIRQNFEPDVVVKYLPSSLVYKKRKSKLRLLINESNKRQKGSKGKGKLDYVNLHLPDVPRHTTKSLPNDINQPATVLEPINFQSQESQKINSIFSFQDSHPFDPGLWNMVVDQLPSGYTIPDPEFAQTLKTAQAEVVSEINEGNNKS